MKRLPFLTLLLGALAVSIHCSSAVETALQFDRMALVHGEIWRLFTGHFTHFGGDHLRWDVIAFLAFGSLVEIRSRTGFVVCLGVSCLAITLGVALFQPQFAIYRGLSGVDSAMFGFVSADLLRSGWRERDRVMFGLGALALAGFAGKSVFELATGSTLFVATHSVFQAVPLAHLIGAITGAVCVWATRSRPVELTVSAAT